MSEPRILVVDDDEGLRHLVSRRIERLGHEVERATDGAQGLEMIAQADYDLIVTDIYMPDVTGLELMEAAKEKDPHAQVIVISASATVENAIEALNLGAFGYLTKPFDHMSALDNAVRRALELRSLILDNQRMVDQLKQRADHLKAEVTKRSQQISFERKAISQLLSVLPIGVVVVEEGGKVALTSPMAKKLVEEELRTGRRAIKRYLEHVHAQSGPGDETIQVGSKTVQLSALDMSNGKGKSRKVVILREQDEEPLTAGSLVIEAVIRLKQSLLRLAQGPSQDEAHELLRAMAGCVADLERFMGLEEGPSSDSILEALPPEKAAQPPPWGPDAESQPAPPEPAQQAPPSRQPEPVPKGESPPPDAAHETEAKGPPEAAEPAASKADRPPAEAKFKSGLLQKGAQIFGEDQVEQGAQERQAPAQNGQEHPEQPAEDRNPLNGTDELSGNGDSAWPPPSPAQEMAGDAEEEGASS